MKNKEIAFLSIRIMSIYVFVLALNWTAVGAYQIIVDLFSSSMENGNYNAVIVGIIPLFLLVTAGIILWVFTEKISNYIILDLNTEENKVEEFKLKELQVIAFSIVGLVLFGTSIPELIYRLTNIIVIAKDLSIRPVTYKIGYYLPIIKDIIKLSIGLGLFLGAKGLTGLLHTIREVGTVKNQEEI